MDELLVSTTSQLTHSHQGSSSRYSDVKGVMGYAVLSIRFEVGVSLLLAPARDDKRDPKAAFSLVENAGIQPAIHKRVPAGAPAGAGSY